MPASQELSPSWRGRDKLGGRVRKCCKESTVLCFLHMTVPSSWRDSKKWEFSGSCSHGDCFSKVKIRTQVRLKCCATSVRNRLGDWFGCWHRGIWKILGGPLGQEERIDLLNYTLWLSNVLCFFWIIGDSWKHLHNICHLEKFFFLSYFYHLGANSANCRFS